MIDLYRGVAIDMSMISEDLITNAKQRLQLMRKNSPLIGRTIGEYNHVRHVVENASALDAIANHQQKAETAARTITKQPVMWKRKLEAEARKRLLFMEAEAVYMK